MPRRAIIIGAGPAGLTAALELLRRTDVTPIVLESGEDVGGLSRTVRYKGNRMDIGGHRFFSKSDRVMQWWTELMPPEAAAEVSYHGETTTVAPDGGGPLSESDARARERAHPHAPPTHLAGSHTHAVQATESFTTGTSWRGTMRRSGSAAGSALESAVLTTETLEEDPDGDLHEVGRTVSTAADPSADPDLVMLIRPRKSRIYYLRRFFDYPIRLTLRTLAALGPVRTVRVALSYAWSRLHRIEPERSLEDFLINRFGRELYRTFFKSYTEKVWGRPCEGISAEWGAQRIKGLSLTTAVKHFVRRSVRRPLRPSLSRPLRPGAPAPATTSADIAQKNTDTSLIERFLYPKFGPGQLWEHVARLVRGRGGEIHTGWTVDQIRCDGDRVLLVEAIHSSGARRTFDGDLFFSTMPLKNLVRALDAPVPSAVREVSEGLEYRDFITVGLLVNRLKVEETGGGLLRDTWIYVQEPDVKLGRLQIFNNWSPHLVADPTKVWLGLEYFCYETDDLWHMSDDAIRDFAIAEIHRIGLVDPAEVSDAHVVRVPKTYPAYFGTYNRFSELRAYTDRFENLFLIGRNGMHKYNNQDHSMLTAMTAVDGIVAGRISKADLWSINTEQEYHEQKRDTPREKPASCAS